MSAKEYDILLFGVTGFTGKLATEYLLRKNYDIKWGVCGRSEERVLSVEVVGHRPRRCIDGPGDIREAYAVEPVAPDLIEGGFGDALALGFVVDDFRHNRNYINRGSGRK